MGEDFETFPEWTQTEGCRCQRASDFVSAKNSGAPAVIERDSGDRNQVWVYSFGLVGDLKFRVCRQNLGQE